MSETVKKEQAPKKSWFKGLKSEFKRISWPDRETLTKETTAVVVCSICLGIIIALLDLFIKFGIRLIL